MSDRKRLVSMLALTSSLALLALVLVASIRLSELATVSSRPACLRSIVTLPPGQPTTCLIAATDTDTVLEMRALNENEQEEGAEALVEARVSFRSLCSFREFPERRLIVPRSIPSLYSLRC